MIDPYYLLASRKEYSSFCYDIKQRWPTSSLIHSGVDYEQIDTEQIVNFFRSAPKVQVQPPWYGSDKSFSFIPNSFYNVTITKLGLVQRHDGALHKCASISFDTMQQPGLILTGSQLYLVSPKVAEQVCLHLEDIFDTHRRITGFAPTTTFNLEQVTA